MSTRKIKGRQGEGKVRPENSFVIDKDTYLSMVGLIEKAEKEKKQILEQLSACRRQLHATQGGQITDIGKLERANRQLRKDNEELRNLCCFLDDKRQKNKKTAVEWQSFGKYTAAVLKNEVETFECKLQVLQEQLEKVVQENSELQEMCLYLDRSREQQPKSGREAARLASPEPAKVTVHSFCAPEVNKKEGVIPQFTGSTSQDTLKDSGQKQRSSRKPAMQFTDPTTAVGELQKRVERLEAEKLELVKSLSAAHLLAASSSSQQEPSKPPLTQLTPQSAQLTPTISGSSGEADLESPPDLHSLMRHRTSQESQSHNASTAQSKQEVPPEVIVHAATLLDMCHRLDAMEANGFPDALEEAEVATLRVMISIAWQKLQERLRTKFGDRLHTEH